MALTGAGHIGEIDPVCLQCLEYDLGMEAEVEMKPLAEGPAPRRKGLRKRKRLSEKQEVELAGLLNARTQPGSGNQRGAKGDIRLKGQLRLEAKFTMAESFSLKLEELEKIESECGAFEKPAIVVDFKQQGTGALRARYVVVPFNDYQELRDAARKHS